MSGAQRKLTRPAIYVISIMCLAAAAFAVMRAATFKPSRIAALPYATPPSSAAYKVGDRLAQPAPVANGPRQIKWDDLYPKNWDPYASIKGMDFSRMSDNDPRAVAALERVREALDKAPVIEALNGVTVRIPGFLIPMDVDKDEVRSFLLVPYFGACIHTPPPPANQIIDVKPDNPVKGARMMDAIWITGKLTTVRSDSPFGSVGYRLVAQRVEPYVIQKPAP
ncbi:MAG: hypothetical protein JWN23_3038 [Rhodocyclales bacterium]|nr:hypothetical protein [Rhodocyclales bacterium]